MTTISIPTMRLSSPLNGSQGNWWKDAKERKKQRTIVAWCLRQQPLPSPPVVVTMTRIAPRELDDDNLAGAFKSLRDETAKALGCGDSVRDPIQWRYAQRRDKPGVYGVEISILPWTTDE